MLPTSFPYSYYVPEFPGADSGILYELEPIDKGEKNCVVLIPYGNPSKGETKINYYRIIGQHACDLKTYPLSAPKERLHMQALTSHAEYLNRIAELKQHIQLGNIYELNYCTKFVCKVASFDPVDTFIKLNRKAKAPYACLLKLQDDYILCASPELFLRKEGPHLLSKPIKGTAARSEDPQTDQLLAMELQHSEKERTEHVMAVDVARNDLSVIASKGSVNVDPLYGIESFETVHQMVSTVTCELPETTSFEDIIGATFPMASMTGAPKRGAMDLIDDVEQFSRGWYSGALGNIDENGDFQLCVLIRSIFYKGDRKELSFAVGGAITFMSEAEKEYAECMLKAENMLKVLNADILN